MTGNISNVSALPKALSPENPSASSAKTWKAATDFEAMTINEMIAPMFATIDTSGDMFNGGAGEEQLRPMLINETAKEMQHAGGLGLAQTIYQQMLHMQEKQK